MATYVIGDLQGCYSELLLLLDKAGYQQGKDDVWLVGDLVNRGPDSLRCLRWAADNAAAVVLGNHDLHLLAVDAGIRKNYDKDTISDILNAPDKNKLLHWLRKQPLLHHDKDMVMIHAGLPPQWTIEEATEYAKEVEHDLSSDDYRSTIASIYRSKPTAWDNSLNDETRKCYSIRALTRMRYCTTEGHIDLSEKCTPGEQPTSLVPWFMMPGRKSREQRVVFGHWSTLVNAKDIDFNKWNVIPMDYGCVWGGSMNALCVEDGQIHSVKSRTELPP